MQDEELIERLTEITTWPRGKLADQAGYVRAQCAIALTRLEALAQPVVGVDLLASAKTALMYLETGFIECEQCGHEVKTKDLDAAYELRDALAASPSPVVGDREAIADSLKHCKALILSTGREIPVADGKITLSGDLTDIERTELRGILSLSTPVVGGAHVE